MQWRLIAAVPTVATAAEERVGRRVPPRVVAQARRDLAATRTSFTLPRCNAFETARSHLDGGLRNVEVGYPQFYWEGTPQYADALGRNISKAVSGQLNSQQALDEAAEEWVKIVQKLGIDNQKRQYENFLAGARKLGYKI